MRAEKPWPEVMDLITAASYLGFHPVTLREWKRKGEGPPGRKIGGRWRFLKAALDAYLTETKQSALPMHFTRPPSMTRKESGTSSRWQVDEKYLKALGLKECEERRSNRK